jgi:hypothetical protein
MILLDDESPGTHSSEVKCAECGSTLVAGKAMCALCIGCGLAERPTPSREITGTCIKVTLAHADFDFPKEHSAIEIPAPAVGGYIQYGVGRNYRILSLHYQPSYAGVVAVVERLSKAEYDAVWQGLKP